MKIFIDTGFWLALEMENDQYHVKAKEQFALLRSQKARLFTNDYVISETVTRLIYDSHLKAAEKFWGKITIGTQKMLTLLAVDYDCKEQAWVELKRFRDHKLSFTDGTIVANFKLYRLDKIFTFDKHFKDINLPTNEF